MASISFVIGMLPHIITVICTKIQFFIPCNTFCYQPYDVTIAAPIRHRVMAQKVVVRSLGAAGGRGGAGEGGLGDSQIQPKKEVHRHESTWYNEEK